jgi:hypothetical protein
MNSSISNISIESRVVLFLDFKAFVKIGVLLDNELFLDFIEIMERFNDILHLSY